MKKQKKLLLVIVSVIAAFSLSSCGSKEKTEPETNPPETKQLETEPETEPETENPIDKEDLLGTLDWQDNKENIENLKSEIVTGYDTTIGDAFSTDTDYNILQWKYAEYEDTGYLLLEYNHNDDNFKVIFYKDVHDNVNIAELHINLIKQEKKQIKEWSDSVFITDLPETVSETEEPETTAEKSEEDEAIELALNFVLGKQFYVESSQIVVEFTPSGEFISYGYYGSDPELGSDADKVMSYSFSAREMLHKDVMQILTFVTIDGVEYYFRCFEDGRINLEGDGEFSYWYLPNYSY